MRLDLAAVSAPAPRRMIWRADASSRGSATKRALMLSSPVWYATATRPSDVAVTLSALTTPSPLWSSNCCFRRIASSGSQ